MEVSVPEKNIKIFCKASIFWNLQELQNSNVDKVATDCNKIKATVLLLIFQKEVYDKKKCKIILHRIVMLGHIDLNN